MWVWDPGDHRRGRRGPEVCGGGGSRGTIQSNLKDDAFTEQLHEGDGSLLCYLLKVTEWEDFLSGH